MCLLWYIDGFYIFSAFHPCVVQHYMYSGKTRIVVHTVSASRRCEWPLPILTSPFVPAANRESNDTVGSGMEVVKISGDLNFFVGPLGYSEVCWGCVCVLLSFFPCWWV